MRFTSLAGTGGKLPARQNGGAAVVGCWGSNRLLPIGPAGGGCPTMLVSGLGAEKAQEVELSPGENSGIDARAAKGVPGEGSGMG